MNNRQANQERKYQNAGWDDCLANRESAYDELVAAGSPFAEIYKHGWQQAKEFGDEIVASTPKRACG